MNNIAPPPEVVAVPEMVERVARAIVTRRCRDNPFMTDDARKDCVETMWRYYVGDARDAMLAMREPTEEMLHKYDDISGSYTGFWESDKADIVDGWQAMIDEALR